MEETFEKLKAFIRSLDVEQGRAAREGLTEDELTIYDLLTRLEPKLTKAQDVEVKKVARALLARLHDKVAVFEWHRRQQARSDVRWTIEEVLNELPEEPYPKDLWDEKVEATWQFVFGHPDWQPGPPQDAGHRKRHAHLHQYAEKLAAPTHNFLVSDDILC